jgi:hypothetical protein
MNDYENIFDVAIFPYGGYGEAEEAIRLNFPPIQTEFKITNDLSIKIIDPELANKIMDACEPKEYNNESIRDTTQLYSIVRENPSHEIDKKSEWDADHKIQYCILLSRLIHPTSISFEYGAKVYLGNKNELIRIIRGPYQGLGTIAYLAKTDRDWLTLNDVKELKALFKMFEKYSPNKEISRAMWHFEYAARIYEPEVRWLLITTGTESLIHTWGRNQFAKRFPQIVREICRINIDYYEAKKMYDYRSSYVHGKGISKISIDEQDEQKELYFKMENILRIIIKTAIFNPDLASIFADNKKVKKKWPI